MSPTGELLMPDLQPNGARLISVCGKGGTGKTALTAMMARALVDSGRAGRLLVIDADPALGQLCALGVTPNRTMGQIREEIIRTAQSGNKDAKTELANKLDYLVFEALSELDHFTLLAMGRTETLGCYCPVNSLLRGAIEKLSESFDTILVDGEAGLEQINRQVVRRLDTLVIVSDPTSRGMKTAAAIKDMVEKEKIIACKRLGLVFNRVIGNEAFLQASAAKIGLDVFGFIPHDAEIAAFDLVGRPITELPADSLGQVAVRMIVEQRILT
jgi:CO dehydrogenase maturation factor